MALNPTRLLWLEMEMTGLSPWRSVTRALASRKRAISASALGCSCCA